MQSPDEKWGLEIALLTSVHPLRRNSLAVTWPCGLQELLGKPPLVEQPQVPKKRHQVLWPKGSRMGLRGVGPAGRTAGRHRAWAPGACSSRGLRAQQQVGIGTWERHGPSPGAARVFSCPGLSEARLQHPCDITGVWLRPSPATSPAIAWRPPAHPVLLSGAGLGALPFQLVGRGHLGNLPELTASSSWL